LYQESLKTTVSQNGSSCGSEFGGKPDATGGNGSGSKDDGTTGGDPDKQKTGGGNGSKTKAKGSSKSRKYLVPWSL
ncbi:hypothetical protein, partial [Klebsiella pneumoniae]